MTITFNLYAYAGGAWTDITADTLNSGVNAEWGMGIKPVDLLAKTGQMNFSLVNNTGRYTPGGTAVIASDWGKGTKIRAVFTFDGQEWKRFYGTIDSMRIDAGTSGERKVHVTVLDWMNYAANYPLSNPPISLDETTDGAITSILAGMPIQPLATDIRAGVNIFPTVFNDAVLTTRAYSEFNKLALSEFAPIYVKKDQTNGETLVVEAANSRTLADPVKKVVVSGVSENILDEAGGAILDEAGGNILDETNELQDVRVDNTMSSMDVVYGKNLINRISTSANPTRIDDTESQLYQLDSPIYLIAGEEKSFFVQFTENSSKRLVSALPPETSYKTTLLHFDEQNGEELIKDEGGHPFDDYNMALLTNIKKFGAASGYFAGNAYIDSNSSVDHDLTGDFTIEYWAYYFNATAGGAIVARGASGYVPYVMGYPDGTNALLYMSSNGSSWDVANGLSFGAISLNTWTKYSLCRSGDNFYMAVNGSIVNTFTSSATLPASTASLTVGKYNSAFITACIDELRITKGLGRYTENTIVESEPFALSGLIYAAWSNQNGTGTELSDEFTIAIDYGTAGAEVTVTNTGTDAGYLTTLIINGKIVETVSPVTDVQEDTDSIAEYGYFELAINQPYQQDFVNGREKAAEILAVNSYPKTEIEKVSIYANRDDAHTSYFLNTDVGDLVEIAETQTETDAAFYIQGMGWNAVPGDGGAIVDFFWKVRKLRDNLSALAIKFAGNGVSSESGNRVEFGYLPAISIEQVQHRIWSCWVNYAEFAGGRMVGYISGDDTYVLKGYYININSSRQVEPAFQSNYTIQAYRFSAFPNTLNTWIHLLISYDSSSTSNYPRLFVDGSEYATPSILATVVSANKGEVGNNLIIGRQLFDSTPNGVQFKDFRIYNADEVISIPALATALAAETPYGDANTRGLLFRGFNVRTAILSQYEGASLTENQKVIDDIGQASGTPINAPLGVAL